MGIMDKIKGLFNKTAGGQNSAQTTAPAQDVSTTAADTGPPANGPSTESPTASTGTDTPVEPTSEA